MSNLIIDLHKIFGTKTLERGRTYFHTGQVTRIKLDPDNALLGAQVAGSHRNTYTVHIELFSELDTGEPSIEGLCSCPMAHNCKHVCAVILQAEKLYGAHTINSLIPSNPDTLQEITRFKETMLKTINTMKKMKINPKDIGVDIADILSQQTHSLKNADNNHTHKDWLQQLEKAAEPRTSQSTCKPSLTSCIIYLLRFGSLNTVSVKLLTCRYLKKGGFGKPSRYSGIHNCIYNNHWPASMDKQDRRIVKTAHLDGLLNDYHEAIAIKGTEGAELFSKIIDTGRCLIDEESKTIIKPGKAINGEIRWLINEQGNQIPGLFDVNGDQQLNLLPTEPPYYLKVTNNEAESGAINGLPHTSLVTTLLDAPPLDHLGVQATQKLLAPLVKKSALTSIKLPEKINSRIVDPTPILTLSGLPLKKTLPEKKRSTLLDSNIDSHVKKGNTTTVLAKANLLFDYDDNRIDWEDPYSNFPTKNDQQTIIPRQKQQEMRCIEQLPSYLLSACSLPQPPPEELNSNDFIAGLHGNLYQRNWLHFMADVVPELEDQGWTIEIDDTFPFQFEVIPESDWYAEIEDSENQWFSLKLGINIDGKPLDLLPLLARQINQLPSPDELLKLNKEETIPVALPGGKYINITAERLHLIVSTLLELFGDRPQEKYLLENHHAPLWEEFYAKLGLPWSGGKKLLALAHKLKSFKQLKQVKPAATLQADLRPYQQHGLSWLQFLREYELNGILADDMGLGKTLQTLAHLQLEKQRLGKSLPPSLIVCPTSLIHNWRNEVNRFTPDLSIHIHHGAQRDSASIEKANLVLTSYGIIQRDFDTLSKHQFHYLVLDEAQAVKNPQAKSAKAIRCFQAKHKLCLTGTPMENHLGELWSLFDFLMPGFLGTQEQFTRYYRTPIEKHGKKEASEKLNKRIAPFMLRRGKDLVAKELPSKTEIIKTTQLTGKQRDLYETVRASVEAKVRSEIAKKGLERSQIFILDALLKMRQTCCDPALVKVDQAKEVKESAKLDLLMSLVLPMIKEGRKILIFSQFTTMLALIEKRLKQADITWSKLTGQTRDRDKPVSSFQNGEVPIFLISLKAGGTGLNLTAADTVIHYDPWWNPAVEDQASDRAHRIGQDKPVFIYKLVTEGTVEEKIHQLKEKKRTLANSIYGDGKVKKKQTIVTEDLNVLFEPLASQP